MYEKSQATCSLVINVSLGDTPILQHTLPHILNSHKVNFAEVLIVVDEKPAAGRIAQNSPQYSLDNLYGALENVRQKGYEFRQLPVSYEPNDVRKVYSKWFGKPLIHFRCAGGTPIYAFLYGLEMARYDNRIHLDSDMLIYDPQPVSWVAKAIDVLRKIPQILFVNPAWGPQAKINTAPTVVPSVDPDHGERFPQVFSSRCFLFSMSKLDASFLPIRPVQHPFIKRMAYHLQNRSPYRALEQMIGTALTRKHLYRANLDMEWGYTLHGWNKRVFQDSNISDVLGRIEQGNVPRGQAGNENLDYDLFCARP